MHKWDKSSLQIMKKYIQILNILYELMTKKEKKYIIKVLNKLMILHLMG